MISLDIFLPSKAICLAISLSPRHILLPPTQQTTGKSASMDVRCGSAVQASTQDRLRYSDSAGGSYRIRLDLADLTDPAVLETKVRAMIRNRRRRPPSGG